MDTETKIKNNSWIKVTPNLKLCNSVSTIVPPINQVIAKGDSAASNHYWRLNDMEVLDNVHACNGPTVTLPDNSTIHSTAVGLLPLPTDVFSKAARNTAVFNNLQSSSLISLGQLCDNDCVIHLNKHELKVIKNQEVVMRGFRNQQDGLWDIPITRHHPNFPVLLSPKLSVIIRKDKTKADLATYLHAACFSPTTDTFLKAIKNNHFITWPGLTQQLIQKHLPPSIDTAKGHIKQEFKGLQSTKPSIPPNSLTTIDFFPESDVPNVRTHSVVFATLWIRAPDFASLDLTGRFPYRSSRGNEYMMVAYHYDANAILVEPMKNRSAMQLTNAWKALNKIFDRAGIQPSMYILDNEANSELKNAMAMENVTYQLVPPHNKRANPAERAIQTFKNHLIAGLCSCDPSFPITEWDRLLPQAVLTLNLLRAARVNPRLSAYAYLFGHFDFNRTPVAPPGTKVLVHDKPTARKSFDPRGTDGWYVGPAPEHYRCVQCYIPRTRSIRVSDTVTFFPHRIPFPEVKLEDFIRHALSDIITLLTDPPSTTTVSLQAGNETQNALLQIATILNRTSPWIKTSFANDATLPRVPPSLHTNIEILPRVVRKNINISDDTTLLKDFTPTPCFPPVEAQGNQAHPIVLKSKNAQLTLSEALEYLQRYHKAGDPLQLLPTLASTDSLPRYNLRSQLANHIYNENGQRETLSSLITGQQLHIWL